MQVDISAAEVKPIRNTYDTMKKRFGDKPASRYQEGSYDLQPTDNFHYRPYWDADRELIDKTRTQIVMEDWYAFKDPRQFYYATYTHARAKMQEAAERTFGMIESMDLATNMASDVKDILINCIIPLRHLCLAGNMNNSQITSIGYGTVTTQATLFYGMDHLGVAQHLSTIGLLIDGNTGTSLVSAKEAWLNGAAQQPMREHAENSLCVADWVELFVAQNVATDSLVFPVLFDALAKAQTKTGNTAIAMMFEFVKEWQAETRRWVDMTVKTIAKESEINAQTMSAWATKWIQSSKTAVAPIAEAALGSESTAILDEAVSNLKARLTKCGLQL